MKDLSIPFDLNTAEEIADTFSTPIYIYDELGIRKTAKQLNSVFAWAKDYKNFFAVKATPTPAILKILQEEGMGFDCSSRAELIIMQKMGVEGPDIFFTSNNTTQEDFELAIQLGATINIDDLAQVPVFLTALGDGEIERVAVRYNPGELKQGNAIIGDPTEAKYGMTQQAAAKAFSLLKDRNIRQFGLHTMVASNELDSEYFAETTSVLLDALEHIQQESGVQFSFINIGGGFGVNYKPDQPSFDVSRAAEQIQNVLTQRNMNLQFFTEHGRYVTAPHGYLLSRVRYIMHKHKTYVGLDASMHNLMRPGMYGAYHHLTVLARESSKISQVYDVVGSLCENNDKFAINRELPKLQEGDFLVIHDVGAHGHAMGFNYNGLLRSAELLLRASGGVGLIRRSETIDDYLKTIIWPDA